jgi:hypothetical protein
MPTKLEFDTPEGRLSMSIADAHFMAYDAGDMSMQSPRVLVERMRAMGLSDMAEDHARLLAQNKLTVIELREVRADAEALIASGESLIDTITPRLDELRDVIAQTQEAMYASVERMSALAVACQQALCQIPGYMPPPSRPV